MKLLYLFASRLKQYFTANRFLFVLFIAGNLLASVMFAYFYGNLRPIMAGPDQDSDKDRHYFVYSRLSFSLGKDPVVPENAIPFEKVESLIGNPLIGEIEGGIEYIDDSHVRQGSNLWAVLHDDVAPFIKVLKGKGVFEAEDPYQIMVPQNNSKKIGDTVSLFDQSYRVVSVIKTSFDAYYIPYETYRELYGGVFSMVHVIAAERQDPEQDAVYDLLQETFPGRTIARSADTYMAIDKLESDDNTVLICICFFLATLSFLSLLRYLIDSQLDASVVCRMVGASRTGVAILIFWEAFGLCAIPCGAGLLLHRLLYEPLFTRINMLSDLVYGAHDYWRMFWIMTGISLVSILPLILRYRRLTPIVSAQSRA